MFLAAQIGDLFAGEGSTRMWYSEIFAAYFVTLSQVELPVAKTLRKFFKIFVLSVLVTGLGDLFAT